MTLFRMKAKAAATRSYRDESGATIVSYAIVIGAVGLTSILAVTYLNLVSESKIQEHSEKSGTLATTNTGSASLAGEVSKSTAVMAGPDAVFEFGGGPLFALPFLLRNKDKKEKEVVKVEETKVATTDKNCPGGVCKPGESTCFVAGTLVLTPSGYKKIEDIRVGDEVLSIPEDSPWATAEVPEEEIEFVSDTDSDADAEDADAEDGDSEPTVVDSTAGQVIPAASTGGTGNVTEAARP